MAEDKYWYEAAFVAGVTNALNVAADGLAPPGMAPLFAPREAAHTPSKVANIFDEIRKFYGIAEVPGVFEVLAEDPIYLSEFWEAFRLAFSERQLSRKFKEALAFAVSLSTRSWFGAALHVAQMRRFGVTDRGVMETAGSYANVSQLRESSPICCSLNRIWEISRLWITHLRRHNCER